MLCLPADACRAGCRQWRIKKPAEGESAGFGGSIFVCMKPEGNRVMRWECCLTTWVLLYYIVC